MPVSASEIRVTGALSGGGHGGADDDPTSDGGYLTVFYDAPEGSENVIGDTLAVQALLTAVCNAAIEWLTDPSHLNDMIGSTSESTLVEVAMETEDAADQKEYDDEVDGLDDDPFRGLF
jgi:hypothetical protein